MPRSDTSLVEQILASHPLAHGAGDLHRWMGSIVMDQQGNIALGYSVSSEQEFTGIRLGSRLANDQPGLLPQAEYTVVTGLGFQSHLNESLRKLQLHGCGPL